MADPRTPTILIAWELGAGLGHLIPQLPLVRAFRQRGHRVVIATKDLARVDAVFGGTGALYLQAPIKTSKPRNRISLPRSFAHILHNCGFEDLVELRGLADAWRNLYGYVKPDLVLFDHSPTAMLASQAIRAKRATIGTGFCCPPDVYPFPDFRPWLPDGADNLRRDEDRVLRNANYLLHEWELPPFVRLGQLYGEVDETILTTFRELDHYPQRENAEYWGVWPNMGGAEPEWPETGGKKVFAYLKRFRALPNLLRLLGQTRVSALVYIDQFDVALKKRFQSGTLRFAEERLDLEAVGRQCDLAILNAGHGATVSMLLAGKPILQIPLNLEQTLTGLATTRMKAGLTAQPTKPEEIARKLSEMLASDRFADGACRFAARYRSFDPDAQIRRVVGRVEELLRVRHKERAMRIAAVDAGRRARKSSDEDVGEAEAPPPGASCDHEPAIVIGTGSGQCGLFWLAKLLSSQPATRILHECRPLLPWDNGLAPHSMRSRFETIIRANPRTARIGDAAHFYLPYLEQIIEVFPAVRVICLRRPREETIESFVEWIARRQGPGKIDHWRADRSDLQADPWDACFPKYPVSHIRDGIARYWDEYYARAQDFERKFPDHICTFEMAATLNFPEGARQILDWARIPREEQILVHARFHESSSVPAVSSTQTP